MIMLPLLAAVTGSHRHRLVSILLLILFTGGIAWGQAKISKATIFKQIDKGNTLGFVVQIEGTNLTSPENPRVVLLPTTGITGGGFTQGAATIWKDLSAEQLQNLTSQSFQATEQIAASGGALQKSIFIPRAKTRTASEKAGATAFRAALRDQNASPIQFEIIPVLTAGGGESTP